MRIVMQKERGKRAEGNAGHVMAISNCYIWTFDFLTFVNSK